uniref:CRAL-TRIO domain-containing protein n=1 Tax=Ciona intestinalis TaxID=7719 RepID=H2XNU9_CIOIN
MAKFLTNKSIEKAKIELGESKGIKEDALQKLRERISATINDDTKRGLLLRKHSEADDSFLLRFLRTRKFDPEKAYELLQAYDHYHKKYPDVVSPIRKDEVRQRMEMAQPGVLPYRDHEGRVVFLFKIKDWKPETYPFWKVVQTYIYLIEHLLKSEETQINGIVIIENFEDYSFRQMAAVGISDYKKMIGMLQGAFPLRFKGVHFLGQPEFFVKVYALIKKCINSKLLQRVHLHGRTLDAFHKEFPADIIPSDFGGTAPPYDGHAAANLILGDANDRETTAF